MNVLRCTVVGVLLLLCLSAQAWNSHYLVTDLALARIEYAEILETPIKIEALEVFLKEAKNDLPRVFNGFYDWLESKHSTRFHRIAFDPAQPTVANFLRAARLSPETAFPYVRRLFPGESTKQKTLSLERISPHERIDKSIYRVFEIRPSGKMTVKEVITTYADEPDWLIDYGLWTIPEYGYGKMPYGKVGSNTSGAAFHMQFSNENFLIRKLVPGIDEGMANDRVELFTRLSQAAFRAGHPYWGFRFCAWALHYLEDITQPYHSKAVPEADLWFYVKFALAKDKKAYTRNATQLVSNRHFLYEDFVGNVMQRAFERGQIPKDSERIASALQNGPLNFSDLASDSDTTRIFKRATNHTASSAKAVDSAVVKAFDSKLTSDPTYDLESDRTYDSRAILLKIKPELSRQLLREAENNLALTGTATRTLFERCVGNVQKASFR